VEVEKAVEKGTSKKAVEKGTDLFNQQSDDFHLSFK
jgi:hypothetical protein